MSDTIDTLVRRLDWALSRIDAMGAAIDKQRASLAAAQKRAEEAHDLTAGVSPEYKDAFDIVCDALKGTPYPVGPGKSLPHQVRALIADLQAQQPDDLARKACEAAEAYYHSQWNERPKGMNEAAIYDIGSALAARRAKGGA